MANIAVTQTQVDGNPNEALYPELLKKRDDVTGLIQGNFQISNNVHGEGKKFISGAFEFSSSQPPVALIAAKDDGTSTTVDLGEAGVQVGDLIIQASQRYQSGTPGVQSGFTNINGGAYSSYNAWRFAYKIATSSDTTGTLTISTGDRNNQISIWRLLGSGTVTLGNYSRTSYPSETTGTIAIPTTYNGAVIAIGQDVSNAFANLANHKLTDDSGTLVNVTSNSVWNQEPQFVTNKSILFWREATAGATISNQQFYFDNSTFNSQIIMHWYKT